MKKGLYIHIPFCIHKCPYCDFPSWDHQWDLAEGYIQTLSKQITVDAKTDTLFIGGGTPTALSYALLEQLLAQIQQKLPHPMTEYTVEANPGTLDEAKLDLLLRYGVNRLSIGVQAVQDHLLKHIGRIHTVEDAARCVALAKRAGFSRINLDAMFGLPGQSEKDWEETLEFLIDCNTEHVSCYSLTIAEGTPFADSLPAPLPEEEAERAMYHRAVEHFKKAGLFRYEISNFARPGAECLHNLHYWQGDSYAAFGAGACGYENNCRYTWPEQLSSFVGKRKVLHPIVTEYLNESQQMSEFAILSLRLAKGVDQTAFQERFGVPFLQYFAAPIQKHLQNGLLQQTETGFCLTDRGFDLANTVMSDFLLEE